MYMASTDLIFESQIDVANPLSQYGYTDPYERDLEMRAITNIMASPDMIARAEEILDETYDGEYVSNAVDEGAAGAEGTGQATAGPAVGRLVVRRPRLRRQLRRPRDRLQQRRRLERRQHQRHEHRPGPGRRRGQRLRESLRRVAPGASGAADQEGHRRRPGPDGPLSGLRQDLRRLPDPAAAPARPADPRRDGHRQLPRAGAGAGARRPVRAAPAAQRDPRSGRRPLRRHRPRLPPRAVRHPAAPSGRGRAHPPTSRSSGASRASPSACSARALW